MKISLSDAEVVDAIRAHMTATLPQFNFSDAVIDLMADGAEVDLDSVTKPEPSSATPRKKRAVNTTAKKAEPVAEPEPVVEDAEPESEVADTTPPFETAPAEAEEETKVDASVFAAAPAVGKSLFN